MKTVIICSCVISLVALHCKSNKQDAQNYKDAVQQIMKENSPGKENGSFPRPDPGDVKDILGSWELECIAEDRNHDKMIDEQERLNGNGDMAKDFFQFNADGSCLVTIGKGEAHYKIENKDGEKIIWLYDSYNKAYSHYRFVSGDGSHLVLYNSGLGYHVYKKV